MHFNPKKRGIATALFCIAALTASLAFSACGDKPKIVPPASTSASLPAPPAPIGDIERKIDKVPVHEINFEALQKENPDIIAWIQVPGTVIDDAVLRGIDNAYYLSHNPQREYYIGGSVFIDMSNRDDFSNPVTVAYGHFMPDETLFTQLHKYKGKTYFNENRAILISLPGEKLEYEVVGAFKIGEENILYNRDYTTVTDMEQFLKWLNHPSDPNAVLNTKDATIKDRYIVLSTCLSVSDNSGRFVVVARLAKQSLDISARP